MNEIDDFDSPLGGDASSIWINDLLERSRATGTAEELSAEADVVAAMVRTIAQPPLVSDIDVRRRHRISKTATRTAIVAAALLVGTSTAAATGNLPDAAQSVVSRASSHLGVDIPDPYDDRDADKISTVTTDVPTTSTVLADSSAVTVSGSDAQSTTVATSSASPSPAESTDPLDDQQSLPTDTTGSGPDATGPAKRGLCQAWAAHGAGSPANQHSTAMKNLQAAATAAGQTVEQFCADVLDPESTQAVTSTTEASPDTTVEDQKNKKKNESGEDDKDKDKSNNDKKDKEPKNDH